MDIYIYLIIRVSHNYVNVQVVFGWIVLYQQVSHVARVLCLIFFFLVVMSNFVLRFLFIFQIISLR